MNGLSIHKKYWRVPLSLAFAPCKPLDVAGSQTDSFTITTPSVPGPVLVESTAMASPVETTSRHTVSSWVEDRVKSDVFKKCGHLIVLPVQWPPNMRRGYPVIGFVPHCKRNSFAWKEPGTGWGNPLSLLMHGLNQEPISCPPDCRYYERRYWTKTKTLVQGIFSRIGSGLQWFSGLDRTVQLLILFFMISAIAPRWIPPLINLLKTLKSLIEWIHVG